MRDVGAATAGPFPHDLAHQGDGRHKQHHPPAPASEALGDPQGHHRLARPARKDQLAPVVPGEARDHLVDGGVLERVRLAARRVEGQPLGHVEEIRPRDRPILEIGALHNLATGRRVEHHRLGVRRERRRHHQDAMREPRGARRREERVHVGLGDPRSLTVELGLDCAQAAAPLLGLLGHEIDPDVGAVAVRGPARPLHPAPDVAEPLRTVLARMPLEGVPHEPLEHPAPHTVVGVALPQAVEQTVARLAGARAQITIHRHGPEQYATAAAEASNDPSSV